MPALIVVVPLYRFAPDSFKVPKPCLVKLPAPLARPPKVVLVLSPTVTVSVAVEFKVTPPVPVKEPMVSFFPDAMASVAPFATVTALALPMPPSLPVPFATSVPKLMLVGPE